jgi:hypothetical protein
VAHKAVMAIAKAFPVHLRHLEPVDGSNALKNWPLWLYCVAEKGTESPSGLLS